MEPPPAPGEGRRLVVLIADDGREPPATLRDHDASEAWSVASAPWHPALLARCDALPRLEDAASPSPPEPGLIAVVAAGSEERLPSGYRVQAEDAGAVVLIGDADRPTLVRQIAERLDPAATLADEALDDPLARDFLALGSARRWLRDLTEAMGHIDALDHESLAREALAGARAWAAGDQNGATNRLRAAFELLTQARERFYPVDAYLVDLCLLDPTTRPEALGPVLEPRIPVTIVAPAAAIERLAEAVPAHFEAIRHGITEGWADVAGGAFTEEDEPLRPVGSILWQFRRAKAGYRRHLDDRDVETLARRRFGLYPQLPQVARRFNFRFGLHLGLDAGRFPIRPETKRLWEAPDGSTLEALIRPPIAADRPAEGARLPWRIARTMKDDHVATVPMAHWPDPVAPWYLDLRRVAAYSPVLARWVTLNDYFHRTDRPYETLRPELDSYHFPYLAQTTSHHDPAPISRRAAHAWLRTRLDGVGALRALDLALSGPHPAETPEPDSSEPVGPTSVGPETGSGPTEVGPTGTPSGAEGDEFAALENALETGHLREAGEGLDRLAPTWTESVARAIDGGTTGGRAGYLVLNPTGIPRRAAVLLPEAAADLRPEGPLRAAQLTEEGVRAVVDLPAFGYAWVPRETELEALPADRERVGVRERTLFNEAMEVEIDEATGGIRALRGPGEPTARLGQRLALVGAAKLDMTAEAFEVDYAGPALVQAVARGTLADDGRPLARFEQRYRLWTGRPMLELDVRLSDLDPDWLAGIAAADPWENALACRWAWPDANAMLRRTSLLAPGLTEADRPETPDALDVSTRHHRTALLFGGLAHHRRHGPRMLDTLLVAGRESARRFRLGVALDQEYPWRAAADLVAPAFVVPSEAGPPKTGPSGWFFHLDNPGVAVVGLAPSPSANEGRGWGVVFDVLETTGRASRCRLRCLRDPQWARLTDFDDQPITDLALDGDAVALDLTPHELARVEVTLG